jgi:hypothetical protein
MRTVAGWLVGASVALCSAHAFGEAAPPQAPPPQAQVQAPQPQAPQPQAPQPKAAPQKAAERKTQAKAAPKQAPRQPAVPKAGDGAASRPAPRCKVTPAKGTPIFEARYAANKKVVITRLYASGTFTRTALKQSLGTDCIEKDRLDAIRAALAESPWRTTKSPAVCQAATVETTEIYTAGKLRFTSRQCNPLVLDENSSHALDLFATYVGPFGLDLADGSLQ